MTDILKLNHWYISPIYKNLCGNYENSFVTGLKITGIKVNQTKTRWIVTVGKAAKLDDGGEATRFLLDKETMDSYFVKNHLAATLVYLNNFLAEPTSNE